jgi:hypothetical protein
VRIIFIVILMAGLAYGQDSTVTQVVERFSVQMNEALDQIIDFQTQINSLRVRILALEYELSNADTSMWTIGQIDSVIMSLANCDTSKYTIAEIDSIIGLIK